MTVEERNHLLEASVPIDRDDPHSRRFTVRRVDGGALELYDLKWTRDVDGEPEFHGHPATRIDRSVLKALRERKDITDSEYKRLAKRLPGC
ncbi:MAG: hypothetical protein IT384_18005 [Deltaproteobacteria bacterium]|nr:hypothetical protein [Deltaproteobacteria bacterium]